MGRTTMSALLVFAGLAFTADAEAAPAGVRCGDRITRTITLTADLHCKKDGLKIGAHGIGINLGGFSIIGSGRPGSKGIQNSGYDRVVIDAYAGGSIRGFDHGIELRKGANNNEIIGFYSGGIRGGHYGVVMYDSSGARLDDNSVTAGDPKSGYDGGFGAAFGLYRSHDNWFEENYSEGNGVNMVVLEKSHGNDLTEFNFRQEIWDDPAGHLHDFDPNLGTGILLRNSDKNRIVGNIVAENANDGIYLDSKSTGNLVGGNLAINNNRLGINVRGKNNHDDNRAFGNGWSAQCRGVNCDFE